MALLDQILKAYDPRRPAVLGTVVDLLGSGYRRPGARILIFDDGGHVGAISGGCLEKDVARNARAWVEDGPMTVLFDTRSNRFEPLGKYGTGCEGVVHLFLQPMPSQPSPSQQGLDPLAQLAELRAAGKDAVLVTAYACTDDDAPLGCVAVVDGTSQQWADALPHALRPALLQAAEQTLQDQRTAGLELEHEGATWRFLVEYARPPLELVVVGTGADAAALVQVARPLGWRIRVVGTDPLKLDRPGFAGADTVCLTSAAQAAQVEVGRHSYVVQMTHHFEQDARMLPHWLASPAPYVGLLGPKSRTARLMTQLHEDGALPDADQIDKLATPVGLDLGGEDPYEVAVSIVSQIVARKNGRDGGPLSKRNAPIHEPHRVQTHTREVES
jgi:xanthine/CO dehydrogenase XdhC/CoxF family maturation factor